MGFLSCLFFLFVGFLVLGVLGTAALPLLAVAAAVALVFGLIWAAISVVGFALRLVFGVVFGIGGLILGAFGLLIVLPLVLLAPLVLPLLVIAGVVWLVRWAQRSSQAQPAVATLPPATA